MTATVDPARDPFGSLIGTLPLIILSGGLFVGSYLIRTDYPRLGPGVFPVWELLLTLGIVAAIGSVVSWFFASDEVEISRSADVGDPDLGGRRGPGPQREAGRPAPEISSRPTAIPPSSGVDRTEARAGLSTRKPPAPWDEDALPPVAPRGPRPVLTTPYDPGEIGRALEEIADIERELSARRLPSAATGEAPARA